MYEICTLFSCFRIFRVVGSYAEGFFGVFMAIIGNRSIEGSLSGLGVAFRILDGLTWICLPAQKK